MHSPSLDNWLFAERHAPTTFTDLVIREPERSRLALYAATSLSNSVILYGPNGTGKSRIVETAIGDRRRRAGCTGPYIHRLACVDIDAQCGSIFGSYNLMLISEPDPEPYVHLEELDQLVANGQLRLSHALDTIRGFRFIATTNDISKVDRKLRSRCDCIYIGPPDPAAWLPRAQSILRREGVMLSDERVLPVLNGKDDVRDILRDLETLVVRARGQQQHQGTNTDPPTPPVTGLPSLSVLPGNSMVQTSGANLLVSTSLRILDAPSNLQRSYDDTP